MCSVIPTSVVLYLPASIVDVDSYCHASRVTNPRQYVYTIFTVAIWVYLPGIIGIFSVAILGFHIIRTRRETQRALQTSRQYYGPAQTVGQPGPPDILQRTLINIIWFPITPILSLWLNVILISVAYYKRRTYLPLEYINSILLGLQSVLIAIALVVNPTVRDALAQYARKRRRRRSEKAILQQPDTASPGACGLPPVHPPSIFGEDELDSGSISEL
ncbi:hypothetical protein LPJ70_006767 [Coemansia sp. RSA 2708]|nr:hypothetical protein LPJ70_006767 [Coemansia sp. RSA 2708]